jgi:hypothetical protein
MADQNSTALMDDAEEIDFVPPNGPRPNGIALRALPDDILEQMLDIAHVVSDCEEEAEFGQFAKKVLVDIEKAIAARSLPAGAKILLH